MKKQHVMTLAIVSLIVISGALMISACASIASAQQPSSSMEAYVNTAAAATVVQHLIETEVARQSVVLAASQPEVQVQATEPPAPTPTAAPTRTAAPTAVPATATTAAQPPAPTATPLPAAGPQIVADLNTNCRVGPSTSYRIITLFAQGEESTVQGLDQGKNWWYIANPNTPGESCWVWEGSTTVIGDTSTLPVVDAPAHEPRYSNHSYNYYGYSNPYGWCGYPAFSNCWNNCYQTCGKKGNCVKPAKCKPNKNCDLSGWWTCETGVWCSCVPVFQNSCRYSNCPPLTEVNYKNYCKNYPKCCNWDEDNDVISINW